MSERSFPFDDVAGDRPLSTAQWARHTAAMVGNGVVPGFADELEVVPTAPESLAVDVSLGRFWVEGRYFEVFSAAETVTLATADPTNPRIDRIVARRSIANREVTVEALTGTPGVSPSAPALTQSVAGDWEESLAQVAVGANETTIVAGDITDERVFAPLARGAVQVSDTLTVADTIEAAAMRPVNDVSIAHVDVTALGAADTFHDVSFGVAFTAPPSGLVHISWYDFLVLITGTESLRTLAASIHVRTGNTIGSGTEVLAPDLDRVVNISMAGETAAGTQTRIGASAFLDLAGLTSGNEYNVVLSYEIAPSTVGVTAAESRVRRINVRPEL